MSSFKKITISALLWLLFVVLFSAILIAPYIYIQSHYMLHNDLEGKITTIYCGSSQCQHSFSPNIIDEITGTESYNTSSKKVTIYGREALIASEAKRNPLSHVIIEISADALMRSQTTCEGDMLALSQMPRLSDRFRFLCSHFSLQDLEDTYGYYLVKGMSQYKDLILGDFRSNSTYKDRGFHDGATYDMTIAPEARAASYQQKMICAEDIPPENLEVLESLLSYCADQFENTTVVVVPVSDAMLWKTGGWDDELTPLKTLCSQYSIDYMDFNLIKSRASFLNDSESFFDKDHMSTSGGEAFSRVFAEVALSGKSSDEIDDLFYDSYEQMLQNSPYCQ